jgi:hypothetical protein
VIAIICQIFQFFNYLEQKLVLCTRLWCLINDSQMQQYCLNFKNSKTPKVIFFIPDTDIQVPNPRQNSGTPQKAR